MGTYVLVRSVKACNFNPMCNGSFPADDYKMSLVKGLLCQLKNGPLKARDGIKEAPANR